MPRVVHFEIHAGDPDRAVNFYKTLFEWNFQKWEGPMEY
jgi:predicted enzyme related to lactoylglutathione lyase